MEHIAGLLSNAAFPVRHAALQAGHVLGTRFKRRRRGSVCCTYIHAYIHTYIHTNIHTIYIYILNIQRDMNMCIHFSLSLSLASI